MTGWEHRCSQEQVSSLSEVLYVLSLTIPWSSFNLSLLRVSRMFPVWTIDSTLNINKCHHFKVID